MSNQIDKLWENLAGAGIVQGSKPENVAPESPWYIKVLLAFSGWLAAIFLLGFLGMGLESLFDSAVALLFLGSLMIGTAFGFLRVSRNEFLEHLSLAVSLTGQGLIFWAIFANLEKETGWLLSALFQALLALAMPNYIHRVISAFLAASFLSICLAAYGLPFLASGIVMFAAAWLWLHEFSYPEHMHKLRPMGYGLVLALIQIKGSALYNFSVIGWYSSKKDISSSVYPWIDEALICVVALYVVWTILQRLGHAPSARITVAALAATTLIALVSMEARGITIGLLILLLGFSGSNRTLLGLGIASLLFYVSSYYYLLDATLLEKSLTLLALGLILLSARWLLLRLTPTDKELSHG